MENKNPLSPHIQIYNWHISSLVSIGHRITGVINTIILTLISLWLASLLLGEVNYKIMYNFLNYNLDNYSWLRVVLYLNIVLMMVMPLNFQINSNYMYLAYPPNVNNPLIIGEWPYYVIYWEFIIVIFTYTTYVISTKRKV